MLLVAVAVVAWLIAEIRPRYCALHGARMQKEVVYISYGLIGYSPEYKAAFQTFSNANNTIAGGCIVGENSPTYGRTFFCAICRDLKAQWGAKQSAAEKQAMVLAAQSAPSMNATNVTGRSLIEDAARNGDPELMRLILRMPGSVDAVKRGELTPLYHAVAFENEVATRLLLEAGASLQVRTSDGRTALHQAAEYGGSSLVELLVEHHADVNARDEKGRTPLWFARHHNKHRNVQEFLRSKGAIQ